jgi:hypothetical protein
MLLGDQRNAYLVEFFIKPVMFLFLRTGAEFSYIRAVTENQNECLVEVDTVICEKAVAVT